MAEEKTAPSHIQVRGARIHNLKNVNVDVPLNRIVAQGTPDEVKSNPESVTGRYL